MNIYFLIDGMGEDLSKVTILDSYNFHNLNLLANIGEMGLYKPIMRKFVSNVETYVVFPYFFGLTSDSNPGRAGLELFKAGINVSEYPITSLVRIIENSYDLQALLNAQNVIDKWSNIPLLNNMMVVENILIEISNKYDIKFVKSNKRVNLWAIGSKNRTNYERFIAELNYKLFKINCAAYSMLYNEFSPKKTNILVSNTYFCGWAFNSLQYAFEYIGIKDIQANEYLNRNSVYEYEAKIKNFNDFILNVLQNNVNTNNNFIIFIKEVSSAAKENINAKEKRIEALSFVDKILGSIFNHFFFKDVNLILLSDHQTNFGNKHNFDDPSIYCYSNLKKCSNKKSIFSEKEAYNENGIILQKQLIHNIYHFIK